MPGEPEHLSRAERSTKGVPVDDESLHQILDIASCFSVDKQTLQAKLLMVD